MNTLNLLILAVMVLGSTIPLFAEDEGKEQPARLTVRNQVLHTVDDRLFGQFMERAGAGEPGPEAALTPGTRQLQPEARRLIGEMNVPILRFPGGSRVEYGPPWTHLIDGAYDRSDPARPVETDKKGQQEGNEFGLNEFLQLCEEIKSTPLLVVSLSKSFHPWEKEKLEDSVRLAQAMVAYCNGEAGGKLPADLQRWADLRARNGHSAPYRVRLWQIGNEPIWGMSTLLLKAGFSVEEVSRKYVEAVGAFIRAMRQVDPTIEVLVDTQMEEEGDWVAIPVIDRIARELGDQMQILTSHVYFPWAINKLLKDGRDLSPETLTSQEYWYAAVSTPSIDPANGLSCCRFKTLAKARQYGYSMGVTEWNWNGWWSFKNIPRAGLPNWTFAKGVGSAGFIHAFMREGGTIRLATQSMFIGSGWDFSAIHVDPDGQKPAFMHPCGMVISLYTRNHGHVVLPVEMSNVRFIRQPVQLGGIKPAEKLAILDPVVTRDEHTMFVHVINREFEHDVPVEVNLEGFNLQAPRTAHVESVVGELENGQYASAARIETREASVSGMQIKAVLPRRSVSILRVELEGETRMVPATSTGPAAKP